MIPSPSTPWVFLGCLCSYQSSPEAESPLRWRAEGHTGLHGCEGITSCWLALFPPLSSLTSPQAKVCGWPSPHFPHPPGYTEASSPLRAVCTLCGEWKDRALEEEAEIQLMVPNSGRYASSWKNQPGRPHLRPSEVMRMLLEKSV